MKGFYMFDPGILKKKNFKFNKISILSNFFSFDLFLFFLFLL